jgi:hypothetical protein
MNKINIFDNIFNHQISSSDILPSNFEYIKQQNNFEGITIFTETHIKNNTIDRVNSTYNIGWFCESKSVVDYDVNWVISISHKYDYIFTHDKRLIDYNPNKFLYVLPASWRCHYPDNHVSFYQNKNKLISFAFSNKKSTKGHKYRHEIANLLGHKMDLMGTGTPNPFPPLERVLAYKDYMFTLIIENDDYDYYFSEKILEPFWAGTIPVYWGGSHDDTQINKVLGLDLNGIITFKNTEELNSILDNLNENLYKTKIESVKKNYEICSQKIYRIGSEEFFYEKYLKKFFTEGVINDYTSCVL